MPSFGRRSLGNLAQCHSLLQDIANEAIKRIDFTVIQGSRSNEDQQKVFAAGKSKCPPGKSKHNANPSQAFDFIPSPFDNDWENLEAFREVARVLCTVAAEMGVKVRWGHNWSSDVDAPKPPHCLDDGGHFELHEV